MKRRRGGAVHPKQDGWHCVVCKDRARVIELLAYPSCNLGQALCFPCARNVKRMLDTSSNMQEGLKK